MSKKRDLLADTGTPLYANLHARMDVANAIAKTMGRLGISQTKLAKLSGLTQGRISQILSGDGNLSVGTITKVLSAMGCQFDVVVTERAVDEWVVKRKLESVENAFWKSK